MTELCKQDMDGRTVGNPPAVAFDDWMQDVNQTLYPFCARTERHVDFRGALNRMDLGAISVIEGSGAGPTALWRTPRLIRQLDPEAYMLRLQIHGIGVTNQDDRDKVLRPGNLSILDSSRPYQHASADELNGFMALVIPYKLLPLPYDDVVTFTAAPLPARRGVGALLASLLSQLPRHLHEMHAAEATRVCGVVLDLLTTTLAEQLGHGSTVDGQVRDRALLTKVHSFIEAHLHLPELSVEMVAAAFNVSMRHLYRLFEDEAAGVAGWIRTRRLEAIRRDLADPAQKTVPISQIVTRRGFVHSGHVNRLFKAAYGMTPGEFRRIWQRS